MVGRKRQPSSKKATANAQEQANRDAAAAAAERLLQQLPIPPPPVQPPAQPPAPAFNPPPPPPITPQIYPPLTQNPAPAVTLTVPQVETIEQLQARKQRLQYQRLQREVDELESQITIPMRRREFEDEASRSRSRSRYHHRERSSSPRHHRHRSYSRSRSRSRSRHRRHRHRYSGGTSSDSSPERNAFKHHRHGEDPISSIFLRYPTVEKKWFKKVFYGQLNPTQLTKFSTDLSPRNPDKEKDVEDAKSISHLMRCFEVYGQAICYFSAPPINYQLQEALSDYRIKLSEFAMHYTFESVRTYHYSFMQNRINIAQDSPSGWRDNGIDIRHKLVAKPVHTPNTTSYKQGSLASAASSGSEGFCRNFQEGKCTRASCRYQHLCSTCNGSHGASTCKISPANATAMGSRR